MQINFSINIDDGILNFLKTFIKKRNITIITILTMFSATIVYAAAISKPYNFTKGDTVMAGEINENFDVLYQGVNDISLQGVQGLRDEVAKINESIGNKITSIESRLDQVNEKVRVQPGIIIMWSGKDITKPPHGWKVCNGMDDTPDLRDRFIIGANRNSEVAGDGYYVNQSSDTPNTHSHNINHEHLNSVTMGGYHSHIWSRIKLSIDFNLINGVPWSWEYYNRVGEGNPLAQWKYGVELSDNNPGYIPMARVINDVNPESLLEEYWTDIESEHGHDLEIDPLEASNEMSGETECAPPFYSLVFIIKGYEVDER